MGAALDGPIKYPAYGKVIDSLSCRDLAVVSHPVVLNDFHHPFVIDRWRPSAARMGT